MPHLLSIEKLDKDSLQLFLSHFPAANRYVLAVSGGLDSAVLLHLFFQNKAHLHLDVEVVYIDHQLHKESQSWGEFCLALAKDYGFAFSQLQVSGRPDRGESLENWARNQRYELLSNKIQHDAILFTAHHLDDQLETFFLKAFRGAGARGLAAMSVVRPFADGLMARPLLSIPRKQLMTYAKQHDLSWVDDPSNKDISFDRNYIRSELMPIIASRWPGYRSTINRLIEHQFETSQMLDEIAQQDLADLIDPERVSIDVSAMRQLSNARQKNLLLYWAREMKLATPNSKHLHQILENMMASAIDTSPCVNWADVEIRRYRNRLYLFRKLPPHKPADSYTWDFKNEFEVDGAILSAVPDIGTGIAVDYLKNKTISIRFRQGGEHIKPSNKGITKTVKQVFQECGVLPWYRDRFPMIYIENDLAALPGICINEEFSAEAHEPSVAISWSGFSRSVESHG